MRFWNRKLGKIYSDEELRIIREEAIAHYQQLLRDSDKKIVTKSLLESYLKQIDRQIATIEKLKAENANLQYELNKYKELYADETQKRLAFAEQLRQYEGGDNADS